jgi:hypothetical protein
MSCCGTAKEKPSVANSKSLPRTTGAVATQPGLQPMMEKPPAQFNQFTPSVSPPPQVHSNSFNVTPFQQPQMTGNQQQQQQWAHTTPSPAPRTTSDFGSFNTATSSTAFGASTFQGSLLNGQTPYASPQASLLRSTSPPSSNMLYGQPKANTDQDEGKMSVSIDFGIIFSLFTSQFADCHAPRHDVLWCCEFT